MMIEDTALALPAAERIALAQTLWDSVLEHQDSVPISEELKLELRRRVAEAEAHPELDKTWDEVRREVFGDR